ncbi:YeiH family protein [Parablastomonas sp. CN1-191]|uniref:YeiH family protein n=1 Tax=Parablastomonas sp. CN1-191 TaxID=3400908 RepID=UPI003BF77A63
MHEQRYPVPTSGPLRTAAGLVPGIAVCLLVTGAAYAIQAAEGLVFGRAWLEALVLAILIGTAIRSSTQLSARFHPGMHVCAAIVLEIAVVLLGASVSAATIAAAGVPMLIGIVAVVTFAIAASFTIGRLFGLPARMALLVACGNSICGNSAIAAVAPVIGADSDDVAAAIAFTAVLGVAVVLGLPVAGTAMGMSAHAYGAFAGLTVYAVPQVIAATAPLGSAATAMGTLVKLVRVLMLGPVCVILAVVARRLPAQAVPAGEEVAGGDARRAPGLAHVMPWFIVGFVAMVAARSAGLIPAATIAPIGQLATMLTVVSMAALGLGVDMRTVARAGGRVTATVVLSLLVLGLIGLGLLAVLHML